MKLIRNSTIKEVSETVEFENGNAYTRTEKWKLFMNDYVLENIIWTDMFGREIATYKNNAYFKSIDTFKNHVRSLKESNDDVLKFKELERAFKLMKISEDL